MKTNNLSLTEPEKIINSGANDIDRKIIKSDVNEVKAEAEQKNYIHDSFAQTSPSSLGIKPNSPIKLQTQQINPNELPKSSKNKFRSKSQAQSRNFDENWKEFYVWLIYDKETNLMFCSLCKNGNKKNVFVTGCDKFRRDYINDHQNFEDHKQAVAAKNASVNFNGIK